MTISKVYHNSHEIFYRQPFGAVPCEQKIILRVKSYSEVPVEECCLRLWEKEGQKLIPMVCIVNEEVDSKIQQTFEVEYRVSDEPGLLWYYFRLHLGDKTYYYGNNSQEFGGEGVLAEVEPSSFQITVYLPTEVPSWYKEGIVYQIFVDRFFNGNANQEVLNPKKGSLIHGDWNDNPFYIKDQKGRINRWNFFGGNLSGVIKKLPYLQELGISIIYFNPIFEASSNHKYDTADYHKIDPMFGDEETFETLIQEADKLGIHIILDGVFSHTGSDSIYFNKYGNYPSIGAFQSADSPYYKWYRFVKGCDDYECWWGVDDLPNVEEMEPTYRDFIYGGPDSVIGYWMAKGVKGWRLDVADELPDEFIKELKSAVKANNPESVLIGEVWEDASRKESYGKRREYFWGEELDATMNYPWRITLLDFILGKIDSAEVHTRIMSLYENYPRENFLAAMNLIGSHDRIRILTLLGEASEKDHFKDKSREEFRLAPQARELAVKRLKLLSLIQMTFPGVPCVYYGDEVGMEGFADPYNRGPYPWGREDTEIQEWYKRILRLRKEYGVFHQGDFSSFVSGDEIYGYKLSGKEEEITILVNRSLTEEIEVEITPGIFSSGDENSKLDRMLSLELLSGEKLLEYSLEEENEEKSENEEKRLSFTIKIQPLEGKVIYSTWKNPSSKKLERSCGVLLHLTSLPSSWGVGDMGEEARKFVDFLSTSGQSLWQILPLNPPGSGYSPYQSSSVFAGNTLLISIETLIEDGFLTEEEARDTLPTIDHKSDDSDYSVSAEVKEKMFRKAFIKFNILLAQSESHQSLEDYLSFKEENNFWLDDYCLYVALKNNANQLPWYQWEAPIASRDEVTLEKLKADLNAEIGYQCFIQYIFFRQWKNLKKYANSQGITIVGDLPIYVAGDSCDTWVNQELFKLDSNGKTLKAAGVPPDYFSEEGQHWGNPLYDWEKAADNGYMWWKARIKHQLELADFIRLDHFRGFEAYWEIPAEESTAINGRWLKGPGKKFFEALEEEFGSLPFIAEDLGFITPEVHNLRNILGFPGMRVLQFETPSEQDSDEEMDFQNTVYYTGTHDNDTLIGWHSQVQNCELTDEMGSKICQDYITQVYKSESAWVIVPLQDILFLDTDGRMNTPGTISGNWEWSMKKDSLTERKSEWLRELAVKHKRTPRI